MFCKVHFFCPSIRQPLALIAVMAKLEGFTGKAEEREEYVQALEQYFITNGTADDKK